jgi:hypothetical protein
MLSKCEVLTAEPKEVLPNECILKLRQWYGSSRKPQSDSKQSVDPC